MSALESPDFSEATEPVALFARWMAEAESHEPVDPNAMALATVDADGALHEPGPVFTRLRSGLGFL